MNIKLLINSSYNQTFESIQAKMGVLITLLQSKVRIVALAILACCAVCYVVYLRFKAKAGTIEHMKGEKKDSEGKVDSADLIEKNANEPDHPESLLCITTKPEPEDANVRFDDRADIGQELTMKRLFPGGAKFHRMKVVDTLGGREACKKIPVVSFKEKTTAEMDELDLFQDFPKGHSIVQGEDAIGRKVVILRLQNKNNGEIFTRRVFQRYREVGKQIELYHKWIAKDSNGIYKINTDYGKKIYEDLKRIVEGTDPDYALCIRK
jgi:hypothetical protein